MLLQPQMKEVKQIKNVSSAHKITSVQELNFSYINLLHQGYKLHQTVFKADYFKLVKYKILQYHQLL